MPMVALSKVRRRAVEERWKLSPIADEAIRPAESEIGSSASDPVVNNSATMQAVLAVELPDSTATAAAQSALLVQEPTDENPPPGRIFFIKK
jgi:hypothetical protein